MNRRHWNIIVNKSTVHGGQRSTFVALVEEGHDSVKKPFRVMALSQNIALMMVNKCVKFHKASLNGKKVMTKVKVWHAAAVADDTGVMTITRLFVLKQSS